MLSTNYSPIDQISMNKFWPWITHKPLNAIKSNNLIWPCYFTICKAVSQMINDKYFIFSRAQGSMPFNHVWLRLILGPPKSVNLEDIYRAFSQSIHNLVSLLNNNKFSSSILRHGVEYIFIFLQQWNFSLHCWYDWLKIIVKVKKWWIWEFIIILTYRIDSIWIID